LKCEVEASPPAESFHWTFNSSGEQTELTSQLQTTESGWSRLNYTPTSDLDYGTISCWARNVIGQQKTPCVFQIVAAGTYIHSDLIFFILFVVPGENFSRFCFDNFCIKLQKSFSCVFVVCGLQH